MFVLKVNKSAIRVLETETIYGDSKNIYNVVLLFNEDWNGLTKVITFDNGDKTSSVIADSTRTIATTSIPWELLTYPGTIRISVAGAKNNLVVLPSQFCILGKVHKGNTVEYPPDIENPPSPSYVDQLIAMIAAKGDTIEFLDGILYLKSDGKVISQTEIQNGSAEGSIIPTLEDATISSKSFFNSEEVNQTYYLKNVVIEYIDSDNQILRMLFEEDIVQLVSSNDGLTIYKIDGKVIKFTYSEEGAIIFGSVDYPTVGTNGKSAYEIALDNGFVGTEQEWLDSLKGAPGKDGKSAYELAVEKGYTGTLTEWLESLQGTDGLTAYDIAVENGFKGTEDEWLKSLVGESAYQIAVDNGFEGSVTEWLDSLHGKPGAKGNKGDPGKSAYEIAKDNGYTGTEVEWLQSLVGKSAYQSAVDGGYTGTEEEFEAALQPIKTFRNKTITNINEFQSGTVRMISSRFSGLFFNDDYVYLKKDTSRNTVAIYTLDGIREVYECEADGTITSAKTRTDAYENNSGSAPHIPWHMVTFISTTTDGVPLVDHAYDWPVELFPLTPEVSDKVYAYWYDDNDLYICNGSVTAIGSSTQVTVKFIRVNAVSVSAGLQSTTVDAIEAVSQEDYDNIPTKDERTIYILKG